MSWNDGRYIGSDNNNNGISTTNVTSNGDGSILERLEFLQGALGGSTAQIRYQQSLSSMVDEDSYVAFAVSLTDFDSGAVASTSIDITGITATLEKSTGGAAFSDSGITQPTFAKSAGLVYVDYNFQDAQWALGDVYKLSLSGVLVTVTGGSAYLPEFVWSGYVGSGDMLTDLSLDNLVSVADGGTNVYPASVVADSIFAYLMSKQDPAVATSYDNTTDSLEALRDRIDSVSADTIAGKTQVLEVSITEAANAGATTLATVTTQPCLVKSVVLTAATASQTDLTSAAVTGGASGVVEFLSAASAAVGNIDAADEQVAWTGAVRLGAGKTISVDLQGTGATAVDLVATIEYVACADGGYLV